ncbi:M23 family metallopeptidase [Corynebacterium aquatimens]|uniref:Murein DD-endopeptidase MepM/ murein hydrolase activator NlpD n=1 Tax=Corynebacterium aquatimens TaxID=1190508 RepID=A0A931GSQ6_9CORY|nr:M23 family metallopeptidase [Corynebacterium aquatimens]MBG6121110.1 murein DD-endopeptidase MepM/ murein hydrolase activator NlpD [Corynebacterium aquatimens]WJY66334.1 Murein hydrolase activator NlpD precursor [Corynebacterium aquatimens]
MKRRFVAAAAAVALCVTAVPAGALSFSVDGTPVDGFAHTLPNMGKALDDIFKSGATISGAGYSIVYDPRSLPTYNESEAPMSRVVPQSGVGPAGRKVVMPAQGTFTSGYGMRWGSMHNGIDIANVIGTPIRAAMDGTVIDAGPAQGFGKWVRIQHDDGTITVYGHMSTIDVTVGQRVVAGQKIAGMGSEGFSTGPHLHFEVRPGGGNAVDPVPWLAERGVYVQ